VRIKVDENLPRQIATLFGAQGHNATTVVEQGWGGFPDERLWLLAQIDRRWLVTGDKGFADIRRYPPGSHCGVILLRPGDENRRGFIELARRLLDDLNLEELNGAVIVATPSGIRIRRPAAR